MPPTERRRWRLFIDGGEGQAPQAAVTVPAGDSGAVDEALLRIRSAIRDACERGGCRTVAVSIHVEGADCDHEVSW